MSLEQNKTSSKRILTYKREQSISRYCTAIPYRARTGPEQGQNRVFPVKFSTQGKPCSHNREPLFSLQGPLFSLQGFPCEKTSQGKPCFHYREWVCSVFYYAHLLLFCYCILEHILGIYYNVKPFQVHYYT